MYAVIHDDYYGHTSARSPYLPFGRVSDSSLWTHGRSPKNLRLLPIHIQAEVLRVEMNDLSRLLHMMRTE